MSADNFCREVKQDFARMIGERFDGLPLSHTKVVHHARDNRVPLFKLNF